MKLKVIVITTILQLLYIRCDSATSTTTTTTTKMSTTTTTTTSSPAVATTAEQIPVQNKDSVANTESPSNNETGESNHIVKTQQKPQKFPETTITQAQVTANQAVKTTKSQQEHEPENLFQKTTTAAAVTNLDNNNNVTSGESVQSKPDPVLTTTTALSTNEGTTPVAHNITAVSGPSNQEPVAGNGTLVEDTITPADNVNNTEQTVVNGTIPVPKLTPTAAPENKSAVVNDSSAIDGAVQPLENTTIDSSHADSVIKNESSVKTNEQKTPGIQITTLHTELNTNPPLTDGTTPPEAIYTMTEPVPDLDELEFYLDATTPALIEPTTYNITNEEENAEEVIDELIEDIFGIETNITTGPPTNVSYDVAKNTTTSFFTDGSTYSVILITSLCFGIIFFLVVIILVARRVYDGWQKRHYSRIDYLVNGMYN